MIEIEYDTIVHTSDHFDKIQEYTEQLMRQGDMYMDDTDGETVRHYSWHFLYGTSGLLLTLSPGQRAASS